MEDIRIYIEWTAKLIEVVGILTIVVGTGLALGKFLFSLQPHGQRSYRLLRQELGKGILLGLEILVAADIIATVVTEPTLDRVLALGLVVLIRTFLSLSIELEIEGKFPWQRENDEKRLNRQT